MKITRFGDSYLTAYVLPRLRGENPQESSFRKVSAQVGGAGGEFDFFGDDPLPNESKDPVVKAYLKASTYAGITAVLDGLKESLIAGGKSKLWYETRDPAADVPVRWAWARCVSIKETGEKAGRHFTDYPVEIAFWLPEGLLYGETARVHSGSTQLHFPLRNRGTFPETPIDLEVTIGSTPVYYVRFRSVNGYVIPAPTDYWNWDAADAWFLWRSLVHDGPAPGSVLEILSSAFSVKVGSASWYEDADGAALVVLGTGQVSWATVGLNKYDTPTDEGQYGELVQIGGGCVQAVANTTPIAVTTTQSHGLSTGDVVVISGTSVCDSTFVITRTGASSFTLDGTSASGTASTGRWTVGGDITGISIGSPPTITTGVNHGLTTGDMVAIIGAPFSGVVSCNGVWRVTVTSPTQFTIREEVTGDAYPANNAATYTSGARFYPTAGATIEATWYEAYL